MRVDRGAGVDHRHLALAQEVGVGSPKVIGEGFGASTRRSPGSSSTVTAASSALSIPARPRLDAPMSPFAWIKKRFVPRGIYARAALILIVPVLAVQLVVSSVFIQRHYENVTEQMALALSLDLNLILDTYARDGAEAAGMAVADALEVAVSSRRAACRTTGGCSTTCRAP
jgi:hypothetical protein